MHEQLPTLHVPFVPPIEGLARPTLIVLTATATSDAGRVFTIDRDECVLGRGAEADVQIHDQGISRAHAKIVRDASGAFHLHDLQSRNGTYHNGVRVAEGALNDSDRIQLGSGTIFRFLLNGASDSSAHQALTAAGMGTWSWNASTGMVSWSEQVERMLDLPASSLRGLEEDWSARVWKEDLAVVRLALEKAAHDGTPCELEFRVATSGQLRWLLCVGEVLSGQPTRIGGTVMEITARKTVELELRRQALLFESLYDGVMVMDLNGHIIDWNSSAERMFGLSKAQAVGKLSSAVVDVPDAMQLTRDMLAGLAANDRWTGELAFHYPSGKPGVCEAIVVPLKDTDGHRIANIGIHRDVTERTEMLAVRARMESELRLAQKLQAVGQLAAGVAHEINTPIQSIVGNVEFLKDAVTSLIELVDAYRAAIDGERGSNAPAIRAAEDGADMEYTRINAPTAAASALDGVGRVAKIVRAMKDLSRPDQIDQVPTALNAVLENTLIVAQGEYRGLADIETDFADIPTVRCHAGEIGQVFFSLIVNAVHAIEDVVKGTGLRGKIALTTRFDGAHVVVSIRDTGCGIPDAIRDRVFDPFFTTKNVGRGSGQGLALARAAVVDHLGGRIEFESDGNSGTTFVVRLPVHP